jgi:hypothetical protein
VAQRELGGRTPSSPHATPRLLDVSWTTKFSYPGSEAHEKAALCALVLWGELPVAARLALAPRWKPSRWWTDMTPAKGQDVPERVAFKAGNCDKILPR